jgi:photosystem II stability/assembly factor-like uncharacterized protein
MRAIAAAAACSLALLPLAVTQPAAATPTQTWTTSLADVGPTSFSSISCPTRLICTAVGGGGLASIYRTEDGGSTWTRQVAPPATTDLESVSCPTTTFCIATYGDSTPGVTATGFISTDDGGATWQALPGLLGWTEAQDPVQCVTSSICYQEIEGFSISHNGGHSWSPGNGTANLDVLSCPTITTCFSVAELQHTATTVSFTIDRWNGPKTTSTVVYSSEPKTPSPGWLPPSISCTSSNVCAALEAGTRLLTTTDGGRTWQVRPLPRAIVNPLSLACAPGGYCAIVFQRHGVLDEASTTISSGVWSTRSIAATSDDADPGTISCPAWDSCRFVGFGTPSDTTYREVATRGAWAQRSIASSLTSLSAVGCPTMTTCIAVGAGEAVSTDNGGESWMTAVDPPAGDLQPNSLACASSTICVVAGVAGAYPDQVAAMERTTDGGQHWQPVTLPSGDKSVYAATCLSATTCVVAGEGDAPILRTTDAGATWTTASYLSSNGGALFISCGSTTTCVAAGGTPLMASTDSGATWAPVTSSDTPSIEGISCTSATSCVAIAAGQRVSQFDYQTSSYDTTDGGTHWTLLASAIEPDGVDVACASDTCQELGDYPVYGSGITSVSTSFDGGTTWSSDTLDPAVAQLTEVVPTPSGGWVAVGTDDANGALVLWG